MQNRKTAHSGWLPNVLGPPQKMAEISRCLGADQKTTELWKNQANSIFPLPKGQA